MSRTAGRAGGAAERLAFAAAGALALAAQTWLLRELIVALQGDETAVGFGLAAWLVGISLGALAARRGVAAGSKAAPGRAAAWGMILLALAMAAEVVVARAGRAWLGINTGEYVTLGPALALSVLVAFAPGVLVGWTFVSLAAASATARRAAPGDAIVRLYVFESIGSLGGALAVTFVAIPLVPTIRGVLAIGALALLFAWPAAWRGIIGGIAGGGIGGRVAIPLFAAILAIVSLSPIADRMEAVTQQLRFATLAPGLPLVAFRDTPYQSAAIGGDAGLFSTYASGQLAGSFPDPASAELYAHLLMSLAERPRRVFAAGGAETGMLRFVLRHPVERIDLVIPDRRAFELEREFYDPADREALEDPRVRVEFTDPRRALAAAEAPYDLVLILEREPQTLLAARFATAEFFAVAARHLERPDGVLVASLPLQSAALVGRTADLGASIWGALGEALPVVHAAPPPQAMLVAGWNERATTVDPEVLAARWHGRGIDSEAFAAELFRVLLPPEGIATLEHDLQAHAAEVPPSRDDRPVAFLHALVRRQQVARSAILPVIAWLASHRGALVGLILLPSSLFLLASFVRSRRRAEVNLVGAAWHATIVTGACGMAWSLTLLVSYQMRAGTLYGRIGLLTALFMGGLALGGWLARGAASGRDADAARGLAIAAAFGAVFAAVLAGVLAALGSLPPPGEGGAAVLHGGLLFAAGVVTAIPFPAAAGAIAARGKGTAPATAVAAAPEAADHLGAALAAMVTAALLLPALGMSATALLTAGLQLLSLSATISAVRSRGPTRPA